MPLSQADFEHAANVVIGNEGTEYNPDDPDGGSRYGILQTTYSAYLGHFAPVADITLPEALDIFYTRYWLPSGAADLPYPLAVLHLDTAVNMGVGEANKILARSSGNVATYIADRQRVYGLIAARKGTPQNQLDAWLARAAGFATGSGGTVVIVLLVVVLGVLLLRRVTV